MGGRSSTFKERIKGIDDLLKELEKKQKKKDYTVLDLGDHTQEVELDSTYRNKIRLQNRNYMVCKSMDEVDKDIRRVTLNQIMNLSHKYNNLTHGYLDEQQVKIRSYKINDINLKTQKKSPNYTTIACWSKSSNQICLNQRRSKNIDDIVKTVDYSQSTGHFMKTDAGTQDKYVITHEFGHFLEECIVQRRLQTKDYTQEERDRAVLTITEEICNIARNKYKASNNDLRQMSRYGYNDAYEWFSELFTSTVLSSNKSPMQNAMNEFLKKENINASSSNKL